MKIGQCLSYREWWEAIKERGTTHEKQCSGDSEKKPASSSCAQEEDEMLVEYRDNKIEIITTFFFNLKTDCSAAPGTPQRQDELELHFPGSEKTGMSLLRAVKGLAQALVLNLPGQQDSGHCFSSLPYLRAAGISHTETSL